jgi:hypothetical protein
VDLDQLERTDGRPDVPAKATLLDALQMILRANAPAADVLDEGRYVGTITLERIAREAR